MIKEFWPWKGRRYGALQRFRMIGACSGLDFAQLHPSAGPAPMTELSDISSARP
jgi:hypothetical protein